MYCEVFCFKDVVNVICNISGVNCIEQCMRLCRVVWRSVQENTYVYIGYIHIYVRTNAYISQIQGYSK